MRYRRDSDGRGDLGDGRDGERPPVSETHDGTVRRRQLRPRQQFRNECIVRLEPIERNLVAREKVAHIVTGRIAAFPDDGHGGCRRIGGEFRECRDALGDRRGDRAGNRGRIGHQVPERNAVQAHQPRHAARPRARERRRAEHQGNFAEILVGVAAYQNALRPRIVLHDIEAAGEHVIKCRRLAFMDGILAIGQPQIGGQRGDAFQPLGRNVGKERPGAQIVRRDHVRGYFSKRNGRPRSGGGRVRADPRRWA